MRLPLYVSLKCVMTAEPENTDLSISDLILLRTRVSGNRAPSSTIVATIASCQEL